VVAALRAGAEAVVPVLPVADTVKEVDGRPGRRHARPGRRCGRADAAGLPRDVLERAHASGLPALTDDAGLVEALGGAVTTVAGSEEAFKVTRPLDLLLAEAVLAARAGARR
jgi:2-C-methyl-D-erythritol 4-phosphate cytidylyltransferase